MAKRKGLVKSDFISGDTDGPYRTIMDDDVTLLNGILLNVYTVASAPEGERGQLVYFSDGDSGSPCLSMHDGSTWRRIVLGATISG